MEGREDEVARHREVRRELAQAKTAAEKVEAEAEKVRVASKELEVKVARLKEEAAR